MTRKVKPCYRIARRKAGSIPFDVLPKSELREGQSYQGWLCKKCEGLLAVRPVPTGASAPSPPEMEIGRLLLIVCPHCEADDRYNPNSQKIWIYHPDRPAVCQS